MTMDMASGPQGSSGSGKTEVRELGAVNPDHRGEQTLYQRGEEYIVVSTIESPLGPDLDPGNQAIVRMSGMLAGTAIAGEETMAFEADSEGNVTDWGAIAVANGPGSRQDVLEQLGLDRAVAPDSGAKADNPEGEALGG